MSTADGVLGLNRLHVLAPGPLTTVQDSGREGFAHLGVPRAGPLDVPAAQLANRLVGNPATSALLEVTGGGFSCRFDRTATVAVTGALTPVRLAGRAMAHSQAVVVRAGEELTLGVVRAGVRAYLAVAGSLVLPEVLGSLSHDVLAGLGPPPLRSGDRLPLGPPAGQRVPVDVPGRTPDLGRRLVEVSLLPGPQRAWFGPDGEWIETVWRVAPDSNRVGVRLEGPAVPRLPGTPSETTSEPMVLGAVQVPPSGQPVVFLADHPTTGGYPVIGVVPRADLPALAQRAPGQRVRFVARR